MRVVFCGTSEFAVASLEALVAGGYNVSLCVTQPDRRAGRGMRLKKAPVKEAAERLGIPLIQPERLREAELKGHHADVGAVASYGQMIPEALFSFFPHGMLGVHPSLLPRYRGAAPVAWTLLNGEKTTGVTIFKLCKKLDSGEIAAQEETDIKPGEDAQALTRRLSKIGALLLHKVLQKCEGGGVSFRPQDEAKACYAPRLKREQGNIDWRKPAFFIERLVRAMVPWPGARTTLDGSVLKIWSARIPEGKDISRPPGTIVGVSSRAITVATGQGALEVCALQLPGGRRMEAGEFLAGHTLEAGKVLGGRV